MKLKTSVFYYPENKISFTPDELENLICEPVKDHFRVDFSGTERLYAYMELPLKNVSALYEKDPTLDTFWIGNAIFNYKDGKLKFQRLWHQTAKQNYLSCKKTYEKIGFYKKKHSDLSDGIAVNRKRNFLGFERLRYCCDNTIYTMPFALYKPKRVHGKLPLVIFLHGMGNGGESNIHPIAESLSLILRLRMQMKKNPCMILVPSLPKITGFPVSTNTEYGDPKIGFENNFNGLFSRLIKEYPVDEDRVYIFGCSNGAGGVWSQLRLHPDRYAAAIPMMGFSEPMPDEYFEKLKDVAIWAVHASNDNNVKIGKINDNLYGTDCLVDGLKKAGNKKLEYTRYNRYGHSAAGVFMRKENYIPWLFEQKR